MHAAKSNSQVDRRIHFLLKRVNKTIYEQGLLCPGDRVAVALSGGKDSLALLCLLVARQALRPDGTELVALHITVPGVPGSAERAEALRAHCAELGVTYVSEPLLLGEGESWPLPCPRCARNRRKTLFLAARRLGCNKVALGHHADDAAQTALLNLFHQGRLESMPVRRLFFDGLLTLIRPLLEVDEKDIVDLARVAGFPISQVDCPYAEKSQRAAMARVLREIEQSAPWAKAKLQQAERKYAVQISLKDRPTLSV